MSAPRSNGAHDELGLATVAWRLRTTLADAAEGPVRTGDEVLNDIRQRSVHRRQTKRAIGTSIAAVVLSVATLGLIYSGQRAGEDDQLARHLEPPAVTPGARSNGAQGDLPGATEPDKPTATRGTDRVRAADCAEGDPGCAPVLPADGTSASTAGGSLPATCPEGDTSCVPTPGATDPAAPPGLPGGAPATGGGTTTPHTTPTTRRGGGGGGGRPSSTRGPVTTVPAPTTTQPAPNPPQNCEGSWGPNDAPLNPRCLLDALDNGRSATVTVLGDPTRTFIVSPGVPVTVIENGVELSCPGVEFVGPAYPWYRTTGECTPRNPPAA